MRPAGITALAVFLFSLPCAFAPQDEKAYTQDFEGKPIKGEIYPAWERVVGSGFPAYNKIEVERDKARAKSGQHFVRMVTEGSSTGLQMQLRNAMRTSTDYSYYAEVHVRLKGNTNNSAVLSIRWLEQFLESFRGAALLISHDHRFLDTVATHIVDVDYETIKAYPGNFAHFVRAKREERERREAEIEKREAEIAGHKAFVERFRAKASKARQAQSKLKAIDRIDIEPLPESSRRYPRFRFEQRRPSGRQVVELKNVTKCYDDLTVLEGIDLTIQRGERVAIIGPNGIGKSTLLKVMIGEISADVGSVE